MDLHDNNLVRVPYEIVEVTFLCTWEKDVVAWINKLPSFSDHVDLLKLLFHNS